MSWVKFERFDTVITGRIMHHRVVPGGLEQRLCAIREQYDTQTLRLRSRDASMSHSSAALQLLEAGAIGFAGAAHVARL